MNKLISLRRGMILGLVCIFLVACAAAKKGPTEVHVTLNDYTIEMDKTNLPAGPVKFIIDNQGASVHEVVLEPAGSDDEPFEVDGEASEVEDIAVGSQKTLEWTIDKAGDYQLSCHVPNHFEMGMVTTFSVK